MRHVFIINPAAGKRDRTKEYTAVIEKEFAKRNEAYEILISQTPGDSIRLARQASEPGDEVRLYACGGDGTLNEVVCGAAGFPNVAVTHFPCGSGNDFIKCFDETAPFFDLKRLLDADEAQFDLIRCGERYSINICSVGYDARISTDMVKYKRLPLVTGKGAYIISTVINTIRSLHHPYLVEIDGKQYTGRRTLICVGNGRHYGGAFYPLPDAKLDDGLLDVLLVNGVSRFTVLRAIGKYATGRYAECPEFLTFFRCRSVRIQCQEEEPINLDGETLHGKEICFSVAEEKIRFFYPRGLSFAP